MEESDVNITLAVHPAAERLAACAVAAFLAFAAWVTGTASPAQAQPAGFPARPLTVIAPFTAGSSTDIEIRIYQSGLQEFFRQQVLVDYKPGASNTIANNYVARLKPDGHTMVAVVATSTILPALKPDLGFDLLKDLAPVSLTTRRTFALVAWPGLVPNDVTELVAYARANPGRLAWSTAGIGSGLHMAGEWLKAAAGIDMVMVHYKGSAAAEVDMQAGRVHVTPKAMSAAVPLIKGQKLKIIGIATAARSPLFPEVKTVAEQGFPGYVAAPWAGFFAPRGTPAPVTAKLADDLIWALTQPDVRQRMAEGGSTIVASRPEEFRRFLQAEIDRWARAVKASGAKLD